MHAEPASGILWVMKRRALFLWALALAACAPDQPDAPAGPKYFEATGNIVSIEGEHVMIDHEEIPGFMDAMTMTFPVADASLLEGLEEGAKVTFRVAAEDASYAIDRIEPLEEP